MPTNLAIDDDQFKKREGWVTQHQEGSGYSRTHTGRKNQLMR